MKAAAILLLLGFLVLTAELPVGSADVDICSLPSDSGPCYGYFPRWYYNPRNRRCERFIYGGCQGNANNFKTEAECIRRCVPRDICGLPPDKGPCEARIPRYYYSQKTRTCHLFFYGGCKGNANNFKTEAECKHRCAQKGD